MDMFLRNPRFAGFKFPDMPRNESLDSKLANLPPDPLDFIK